MPSTKCRNDLLRFFVENNYPHRNVLQITMHMKDMTDEQKEKAADKLLNLIHNCKTDKEALEVLKKKGHICL